MVHHQPVERLKWGPVRQFIFIYHDDSAMLEGGGVFCGFEHVWETGDVGDYESWGC